MTLSMIIFINLNTRFISPWMESLQWSLSHNCCAYIFFQHSSNILPFRGCTARWLLTDALHYHNCKISCDVCCWEASKDRKCIGIFGQLHTVSNKYNAHNFEGNKNTNWNIIGRQWGMRKLLKQAKHILLAFYVLLSLKLVLSPPFPMYLIS